MLKQSLGDRPDRRKLELEGFTDSDAMNYVEHRRSIGGGATVKNSHDKLCTPIDHAIHPVLLNGRKSARLFARIVPGIQN